MTREEVTTKLIKSYETYYNVTQFEEAHQPLIARCDFFEETGKYVLSRKAELWHTQNEEFVYLFCLPSLTPQSYATCRALATTDGSSRLHIGPGHMASYITSIFICDHYDASVATAIKKCHLHKNYRFSFYGWMTYHEALITCNTSEIITNRDGKNTGKMLEKILFTQTKRRGFM